MEGLLKLNIDKLVGVKRMTTVATKIDGEIKGNCLFFTAGVDSLFTLYRNFNDIDTLVYVFGFDIRLEQKEYFALVYDRLQEFAININKKIALVQTDYRSVVSYERWVDECAHALAFIAKQLKEKGAATIYVSKDLTWDDSKDATFAPAFTAYGNDARHEKIKFLCQFPGAISIIRVCWESESYNCGHCEKCLRTMVPLFVYGKLQESSFYCHDKSELARRMHGLEIKNDIELAFWRENIQIVEGDIKDIIQSKINLYQKNT